jgi:outer membrane lipoprotein-sorting protein
MKKILTTLVLTAFLFSSCGQAKTTESSVSASENPISTASETSSETSTDSSQPSSSENTQETSDEVKVYSADVDLTAIGGESLYWDYDFRYYDISGELIRYVGNDDFQSWVRTGAEVNMQTFIERYDLSSDEITNILKSKETADTPDVLTISDVETLCSGDQAEINRTFVSPYAVVSESGDIYTIFWLAEHDAQDYEEAGLSAAAIEAALEQAAALEIDAVNTYIEQVEDSLAD